MRQVQRSLLIPLLAGGFVLAPATALADVIIGPELLPWAGQFTAAFGVAVLAVGAVLLVRARRTGKWARGIVCIPLALLLFLIGLFDYVPPRQRRGRYRPNADVSSPPPAPLPFEAP